MTNLFADPLPCEVVVGKTTRFLERGLIHRTERGELVKSKSELVIADKLHARGIDTPTSSRSRWHRVVFAIRTSRSPTTRRA